MSLLFMTKEALEFQHSLCLLDILVELMLDIMLWCIFRSFRFIAIYMRYVLSQMHVKFNI